MEAIKNGLDGEELLMAQKDLQRKKADRDISRALGAFTDGSEKYLYIMYKCR